MIKVTTSNEITMTAEELATVNQAIANAEILAEIALLEAKQLRALREAALGYDGAAARLKAIDDQIAKLREGLNGEI